MRITEVEDEPPRLHRAAKLGSVAGLRRLLDAGANIELCDDEGRTALHLAAANRPTALAFLLARGANVHARAVDDVTALHGAARRGFTTCVRLLLDAGAEIEARTMDGYTPFFLAAAWGRVDVCELLIARGADPNAEDPWGRTPDDVRGVAATPTRCTPLVDVPIASGPPPSSGSPAQVLETVLAVVPLSPEVPGLASRYTDFQFAFWVAREGVGEPIVNGEDSRGRPRYVIDVDEEDPWFRGVVVFGPDRRRWMPIFTTEPAVEQFRKHSKVSWADAGSGIGEAFILPASFGTFDVNGVDVDGIIVNPYGPGTRRILSLEECEWIASVAPVR